MMRRIIKGLIALVAILDIALGAALIYFIAEDSGSERMQRDALAKRIGITEETEDALADELYAQTIGAAMKHISMESESAVRDGAATINLSNDEQAEYAVSLALILLDTNETLAETGLLPPGYRLETISLRAALASESYPCLARLAFYTVDGGLLVGTAARHILLTTR